MLSKFVPISVLVSMTMAHGGAGLQLRHLKPSGSGSASAPSLGAYGGDWTGGKHNVSSESDTTTTTTSTDYHTVTVYGGKPTAPAVASVAAPVKEQAPPQACGGYVTVTVPGAGSPPPQGSAAGPTAGIPSAPAKGEAPAIPSLPGKAVESGPGGPAPFGYSAPSKGSETSPEASVPAVPKAPEHSSIPSLPHLSGLKPSHGHHHHTKSHKPKPSHGHPSFSLPSELPSPSLPVGPGASSSVIPSESSWPSGGYESWPAPSDIPSPSLPVGPGFSSSSSSASAPSSDYPSPSYGYSDSWPAPSSVPSPSLPIDAAPSSSPSSGGRGPIGAEPSASGSAPPAPSNSDYALIAPSGSWLQAPSSTAAPAAPSDVPAAAQSSDSVVVVYQTVQVVPQPSTYPRMRFMARK